VEIQKGDKKLGNNEIVAGFDDERETNLSICLATVRDSPNCVVMSLSGYVDEFNEAFVQNKIRLAICKEFDTVILDCAKLHVTDDYLMKFLTKLLYPLRDNVILVNLSPRSLEAYELLGLSNFITIKRNIDEAVAYMQSTK
jgi:anti-anti-sigma regulatory factor